MNTSTAERPSSLIQLLIALAGFAVVAYCGFILIQGAFRSIDAYQSLAVFPEPLVQEPRASFRSTIIWSIVASTGWLFFFVAAIRHLFSALRRFLTPTQPPNDRNA